MKLKNPKKKALGLLGAVILAALMLPLFAAYEAHVINVKAHIENALKVSPKHIDFGTVFPQETLSASFTVALSDSFMDQRQVRVKDVEYKIVQKLKPIPDSSPAAVYKDLRPFLYKTKVDSDTVLDTEAAASLDKSIGDVVDFWSVVLNVPCIEGALCQDHALHGPGGDCPTFPCGGPRHTTCQSVPEDAAGSGTAGDFGADIWIEVTGFSYYQVVNAGEAQLTSDSSTDAMPKWSPDRTKIAFVSERSGNQDIWVMNADGSGATQLTTDPARDWWFDWSPDGKKMVFRSNRTGVALLWIMNADGSGQTALSSIDAGHPDWSPDGTKIAFVTGLSGNADIWTINIDGSGLTQITTDPAADKHPNYSPDGTKIAFESTRDGSSNIWTMNADGSGAVQLTTGSAAETHLGWSPDGSQIAYDSDISGNWDIWVMNSDGTGKAQLTTNPAEDRDPDWSPSASKIVFGSDRSGNSDIWVMTLGSP